MNLYTAQCELDEIREKAWQAKDSQDDNHKRLFELFVAIEKALPEKGGKESQNDARADQLTDAQIEIVQTSARLEARLIRDVLFKLALWRWLTPDLDSSLDNMQPSDAIAYSAFRDLARILGEPTVLTELDEAC